MAQPVTNAQPASLGHAMDLASMGFRVVWINVPKGSGCSCGRSTCVVGGKDEKSIGKHPILSEWQVEASADPAKLRTQFAFFAARVPNPNLGILLGAQPDGSYLVAVDVDDAARFAELEAQLGPLPPTRAITSARGDKLLLRVPTSTDLSRLRNVGGLLGKRGVDVKAERGQVVAPGSVHSTGCVYHWGSTSSIAELPLRWVEAIYRPVYIPPAPPPSSDNALLRRARAYVERMPPAIAGAGGHDATFAVARKVVQDFALSEQDAWTVLTEYNARCQPPWTEKDLRHKLEQAGRARVSNPVENRDIAPRGNLRVLPVPTAPASPPQPRAQQALPYVWPEAERFGESNVPLFPVKALAPWQCDWAESEAIFCQVPVDLPAVLCLAAASLATSRGIDVVVRDGWVEPTNIWAVCAAMPGERKSPVFDAATKPIFAYQKHVTDVMAPKVAEYESRKRVLNGKITAAESAAIKGKPYENGPAAQAIKELQSDLADLKEVAPPVLLADDVTAEAVARVLSSSGERLGIFSAEGGLFEIMAGRYSESGSNLEIWLKAHSGDAHTVHRIKRDPIFLKRPLITMAVTTQPSVINGLASKDGFRGKGLLARFLYSLPKSTIGTRATDAPKVPDHTRKLYGANLIALLEHCTKPRRLILSDGANTARTVFQGSLEPRLGPDGDLAHVADWAGKLVGLVARIAGVLHCADYAHCLSDPATAPHEANSDPAPEGMPDEIPTVTWLRAQAIGEYALAHARHAFDVMGATEGEAMARRIWAWIERGQRASFTARDAKRAIKGALQADADEALARLAERGLIRQCPPDATRPAHRPSSPLWETNPVFGFGTSGNLSEREREEGD